MKSTVGWLLSILGKYAPLLHTEPECNVIFKKQTRKIIIYSTKKFLKETNLTLIYFTAHILDWLFDACVYESEVD